MDLDLGALRYLRPVALLAGISAASGRIDKELIRADLGQGRPGFEAFSDVVLQSWLYYWPFVIALGVAWAAALWYIGGWWYRVRLKWSGSENPDKTLARIVYIYAQLVQAIPVVLALVVQTVVYENYLELWNSEATLSLLLLAFPFWSCVTSYRGVRARFEAKRGRVMIWFLVLPILMYTLALGLIGALYAVFT
jgi:hypothetical protein